MSLLTHHVTTELGVMHQVRVVENEDKLYAAPNSGLKLGDIVSHKGKRYALYHERTGPMFDRFLIEELAPESRTL